jgi:hypothetical protein
MTYAPMRWRWSPIDLVLRPWIAGDAHWRNKLHRERERSRLWRHGAVVLGGVRAVQSRPMRGTVYVIGGLAIIAFFVVRQRRSERFEQRSLFIPAALAVYGLVLLDHTSRRDPFTASSGVLLSLSAVASMVAPRPPGPDRHRRGCGRHPRRVADVDTADARHHACRSDACRWRAGQEHRRCHRAIEARTPAGSASSELTQPRSINSILY